MNQATLSMRVFAIYLFGTAATVTFAPNMLMSILGLATTEEHWIRMVGMLVFFLGYYYWRAASENSRPFYEWSVFGRLVIVPPVFIAYVLMGWLAPIMLMFAVIDVLGGLWTRSALKSADAVSGIVASAGSKI